MPPKAASPSAAAGGASKKLPSINAPSSNGKPSPNKPSPSNAQKANDSKLPQIKFSAGSSPIRVDPELAALEAQIEAAKISEEQEKLKKQNLEEERTKKAAEEALIKEQGNGKVKLIYERYNEEFTIVDGSITAAEVDDVYCLSFVMPDCKIRLSVLSPQQKREREEADPMFDLFLKEDPPGTFLQMVKDSDYYVFVEQAEDQLKRDQERMRLIASQMEGANMVGSGRNEKDNVGTESCSCVFGNPCVDPYGCKDWDNRRAVAAKNGWKEAL